MKRSLSGLLTLAAIAALASCGDPTGDLQGNPSRIDATPTALVVNVGSAKTLDLQLLDEQGNPLSADFTFTVGDAAVVDVVQDTSFRPGLGKDRLTQRYSISALTPGYTQVAFSSSGVTRNVAVFSYPLSLPAAFSSAAPNVNDEVTVTAPGFKFLPAATVTFGGVPMLITAIAADSSSVSFRAGLPGAGTVTIGSTVLATLTGTPLTLESATGIVAGPAVTSLTGTDAIATAPVAFLIGAAGTTATLTDGGVFNDVADCNNSPGGFPCRIYKFDVPADGDYVITGTWNSLTDIGLYFTDNAQVGAGSEDGLGNGAGGQPETGTLTWTAGTHYLFLTSYSLGYPPPNNVDPTEITVTISH
jgi:hypothetical protein